MTTRTKFDFKFLLCIIKRCTPLKASLSFLLKDVKAPPDPKMMKLLTFNNLGRLMGNHSNKSRPSCLGLPRADYSDNSAEK